MNGFDDETDSKHPNSRVVVIESWRQITSLDRLFLGRRGEKDAIFGLGRSVERIQQLLYFQRDPLEGANWSFTSMEII